MRGLDAFFDQFRDVGVVDKNVAQRLVRTEMGAVTTEPVDEFLYAAVVVVVSNEFSVGIHISRSVVGEINGFFLQDVADA